MTAEEKFVCILNDGLFPPNQIIRITFEKEGVVSLCSVAHNIGV